MNEFTTALTNFQRVQRQAAEREREFVARVRASSRVSVSINELATLQVMPIFEGAVITVFFWFD